MASSLSLGKSADRQAVRVPRRSQERSAAMKSAQSQVYKTASEAWQFLVAQGGLEPGERDGVLVDQIVSRLAPAESEIGIEAALQDVSVERFLNIFFDAVGRPFVGMMRGLLAYFERAGVTEGPNQLVLSLGE